jgi:aspartate racemase
MNHRIVIIGGMGPQASLELHRRIIAAAAKAGAKDNEDYPEILHTSIPIPDFISSGDSSMGLSRLEQSLDALHLRHDDTIVLACNTVHLLLPEIETRYNVNFVSLVQETVESVRRTGTKQIGLIASPTTIKIGLYEKPLVSVGCDVILPTPADTNKLEQAIRHVIANSSAEQVKHLIEPIIERMLEEGAEKVILGCTELSVIFSGFSNNYIVDPLTIVLEQL